MAYTLKIETVSMPVSGHGRHAAYVLFNKTGMDNFLPAVQNDYVFLLQIEDNGNPTMDIRQWTQRHGVGDWDGAANVLGDTVVHFMVPKPYSVNTKAAAALRQIALTVEANGATVKVHALDAGDTVDKVVREGRLEEMVNPTAPVAAASGTEVNAGVSDRERVLDDTVAAVLSANGDRKTLFLSKDALVSVFEGAITPIDSTAKFRGWCKTNGVRFYTVDPQTQERSYLLAADDAAPVCVASPWVWGGQMYPLKSVSTLPFVRHDGSFIDTPGYDESTQVYISDQNVGVFAPQVPESPTQEEAQIAANWLISEVFADFPFVSEADRANALGLMLTALTRYIHNRPTPLFGITAPDPATGKGLLTEVISIILQGQSPDLKVLSDSLEEQRKVITGTLMESSNPVVVWDNVETGSKISSRVLCALHTSEMWTDRVLGSSSSVTLANDRIWIATGNNIGPADDMVRRYIRIGLDAGTPHPEERRGFRHSDLKAWVRTNRTKCMVALMTMIRAWDQAGRPKHTENTPVVGDYQPIVKTVGGILNFSGVNGFLMNQDDVRAKAAEGSVEEIAEDFLHWLAGALYAVGKDPARFSTGHIGEAVAAFDGSISSAALSEVPLPPSVAQFLGKGTTSLSVALSKWLGEMEGRRFGAEKFRLGRLKGQKVDRAQAWCLYVDSGAKPAAHPLVARYMANHRSDI